MRTVDILLLLRVNQWYKNFLVFLPIIFNSQLLNISALIQTCLGFIAFCIMSSANYIINDIADIKRDRLNYEKKNRPLASGKVTKIEAIFLASAMFYLSTAISLYLSKIFTLIILTFFVLTQIYSFYLKNHAFADIIMISINFVLRALSGAYVITVGGFKPYIWVSPWLIICPFFLALFLAVSKRRSELMRLGTDAVNHRSSLLFYTKEMTSALMIISTTCLIMSYSLYTFLSQHQALSLSIPFAVYLILRMFCLAENGIFLPADPGQIIKDRLTIFMLFMAFFILYYVLYM